MGSPGPPRRAEGELGRVLGISHHTESWRGAILSWKNLHRGCAGMTSQTLHHKFALLGAIRVTRELEENRSQHH